MEDKRVIERIIQWIYIHSGKDLTRDEVAQYVDFDGDGNLIQWNVENVPRPIVKGIVTNKFGSVRDKVKFWEEVKRRNSFIGK